MTRQPSSPNIPAMVLLPLPMPPVIPMIGFSVEHIEIRQITNRDRYSPIDHRIPGGIAEKEIFLARHQAALVLIFDFRIR